MRDIIALCATGWRSSPAYRLRKRPARRDRLVAVRERRAAPVMRCRRCRLRGQPRQGAAAVSQAGAAVALSAGRATSGTKVMFRLRAWIWARRAHTPAAAGARHAGPGAGLAGHRLDERRRPGGRIGDFTSWNAAFSSPSLRCWRPRLCPGTRLRASRHNSELVKAGTLTMSTNPTLPPMQFVDSTGTLKGMSNWHRDRLLALPPGRACAR